MTRTAIAIAVSALMTTVSVAQPPDDEAPATPKARFNPMGDVPIPTAVPTPQRRMSRPMQKPDRPPAQPPAPRALPPGMPPAPPPGATPGAIIAGPEALALEKDVMQALIALKIVKVPRANVACEVTGLAIQDPMVPSQRLYMDVSIGQFMLAFIHWSLHPKPDPVRGFSCAPAGDALTCTWFYGGKTGGGAEGWSHALQFDYDPRKKAISRKSLACMSVP